MKSNSECRTSCRLTIFYTFMFKSLQANFSQLTLLNASRQDVNHSLWCQHHLCQPPSTEVLWGVNASPAFALFLCYSLLIQCKLEMCFYLDHILPILLIPISKAFLKRFLREFSAVALEIEYLYRLGMRWFAWLKAELNFYFIFFSLYITQSQSM